MPARPFLLLVASLGLSFVLLNSPSPGYVQDDTGCFLSASQSTIEVGDTIFWRLSTVGYDSGAAAYWGGAYNGSRYIPERIPDYSGQGSWTKIYSYESAKPGVHERFVEIKDSAGGLICKTNAVGITVKEREKVKIGPVALPVDAPKSKSTSSTDPVFGAPIAEKCEASFSYSCRQEKLKAIWNLGSGSGCTVYVRDGRGDHAVSNNCAGSAEIDSLDGEPIGEGGNYQFFVSNGKENSTCYNEMKGQLTVDCSQAAGAESAASSETRAQQVECSLTPSRRLARAGDGEGITWTIRSTTAGASAEWHGRDNGQDIAPAPVENYPKLGEEDWQATYRYAAPSEYLRFVRIKDGEDTICTTDAVGVSVTETGEPPSSITSLRPRTVTLATVDGQPISDKNPRVKVNFPKLFARGETQTVSIFVQYSDGTSDTKSLTFRNKIPGVEILAEAEFSAGEPCDIGSIHWLRTAKNREGPQPLFCRDIEGRTAGSNWITQKQANDWCQGQRGLKALAGDGSGGTVTFYCNGQDWVDERTWLSFQVLQPVVSAGPGAVPAGTQGPGTQQDQPQPQAGDGTSRPPSASTGESTKNPFDICDVGVGCLDEARSPSGEKLFCRNIGSSTSEQYMWVTRDYASDQCSATQVGRTALCAGRTFYCDGTTWRESGGAGGPGASTRTVRRVFFRTPSGEVSVVQGQQVRIPISGGATITLVVEYSDETGNLRSESRVFTFHSPAPQPAQPQPEPEPVQPEQPAAQTCPGRCATATGLTSDGIQCDPNSWLEDNHSCESDSVDFYCFASCP